MSEEPAPSGHQHPCPSARWHSLFVFFSFVSRNLKRLDDDHGLKFNEILTRSAGRYGPLQAAKLLNAQIPDLKAEDTYIL